MHELLEWIVDFVHELGYTGIFIMTFIESSFVPIPAEVTMIPAGYLVQQGYMNGWLVMFWATLGAIGGSLFNYWVAAHYGRILFTKYGKFFFLTEAKLAKIESFFEEHGAISTFSGRLIPGLRHYISFPAGLAHMKLKQFIFYTGLGGGLWMLILMGIGYFIGEEKELIRPYVKSTAALVVVLLAAGISLYVWLHKRRRARRDR